jgi:glycosyltransferase involved in cell wall biosynthesis
LRSLAVRRFWLESRGFEPDVVHAVDDSMSSVALALSELGEIPYIQSVNRFSTLDDGLRLSRRWCRGIVASSQELATDLVNDLRVPAELITVILPGVVEPSSAAREVGATCIPVVGTTGSTQDLGGFSVMLEAAKLILGTGREVEFVIAAEETEHAFLRHRAQKLGVAERVTVSDHGTVGPSFWSLLDIYCQPSVAPGSDRAILYALAHALPSIVTDVKGLRSIVKPRETALLVPPADPQALKDAIVELLESPDAARRLGQHGRESIRARFDPDIEAEKLGAMYCDVVKRP